MFTTTPLDLPLPLRCIPGFQPAQCSANWRFRPVSCSYSYRQGSPCTLVEHLTDFEYYVDDDSILIVDSLIAQSTPAEGRMVEDNAPAEETMVNCDADMLCEVEQI